MVNPGTHKRAGTRRFQAAVAKGIPYVRDAHLCRTEAGTEATIRRASVRGQAGRSVTR